MKGLEDGDERFICPIGGHFGVERYNGFSWRVAWRHRIIDPVKGLLHCRGRTILLGGSKSFGLGYECAK